MAHITDPNEIIQILYNCGGKCSSFYSHSATILCVDCPFSFNKGTKCKYEGYENKLIAADLYLKALLFNLI